MGNLGGYQTIIEASKKVGGPLNLLGIVFGTGIVAGVTSKIAVDKFLNQKNISLIEINQEFEVTGAGQYDRGLSFEVGDIFKVILMDMDDEVALIEKIEDENNPYYVSNNFLKEISIPYSDYNDSKINII